MYAYAQAKIVARVNVRNPFVAMIKSHVIREFQGAGMPWSGTGDFQPSIAARFLVSEHQSSPLPNVAKGIPGIITNHHRAFVHGLSPQRTPQCRRMHMQQNPSL